MTGKQTDRMIAAIELLANAFSSIATIQRERFEREFPKRAEPDSAEAFTVKVNEAPDTFTGRWEQRLKEAQGDS